MTMIRHPQLNPATFPVSSRGCWLSLAVRDRRHPAHHRPMGSGLYLRNHHGFQLNHREICRIDLLTGRRRRACRYEIGPGLLRLRPLKGPGSVDLLLLPPGNVRIRATHGLGLRVTARPVPGNVAFQLSDTLCALNLRSARMRLQVECLEGLQELDAPWREDYCEHIRVNLLSGEAGSGEWALDRYTSTWVRPRRRSFEEENRSLAKNFQHFEKAQPAVARPFARTRQFAAFTNWTCLVSPEGKFRREAMLMSKGWMDQVWSWDNCFNAMALAAGMPGLAMDQLMTVVDRQDPQGVYPDAMNDVHEHYCFNKPPVWGIALREMRRANPRAFTAKRLRPVYASVLRFTDWWLRHRRLPGRKLCYYLHGNDSGWDNSTQFDEGVPLEAPDLNAFLVTQAEVLAGIAEELGEEKTARRMRRVADQLTRAILEELWDGDRFVGIRHGERIRSESLIPCMPLVLGDRLPEQIRGQLVQHVRAHLTKWGPATEPVDSPKYSSDGYWRGPIWGPSTVLIVLGLEAAGEERLARTVAGRFARLCRASGFAENFDAVTGKPLRDPAYSWTASAFLLLAGRYG
ncbi:MAG: amylo-alpha-1,6-glucosidase [Oceanipulchritudo sp.]